MGDIMNHLWIIGHVSFHVLKLSLNMYEGTPATGPTKLNGGADHRVATLKTKMARPFVNICQQVGDIFDHNLIDLSTRFEQYRNQIVDQT